MIASLLESCRVYLTIYPHCLQPRSIQAAITVKKMDIVELDDMDVVVDVGGVDEGRGLCFTCTHCTQKVNNIISSVIYVLILYCMCV